MSITRPLAVALAVMALATTSLVARQQRGAPPPTIDAVREAAGRGDLPAAWALWARLPDGPPKLRVGVELSAAGRQLDQGLKLYDELTQRGRQTEEQLLTMLALSAAGELAESSNPEVRATACGAALIANPGHAACLAALQGLADSTSGAPDQTLALAALANADIAGYRQRLRAAEMRATLRLRLAATMTRLPAADRVGLITPVLADPDLGTQYLAVQTLGAIPGGEALSALRSFQVPPALRGVHAVALARHGDSGGRTAAGALLSSATGYLKIQAARAVAEAGDLRGTQALTEIATGPVDLDRVYAAEALARINPALARNVIVASLAGGSAAVKPTALLVAGLAGFATDPVVYHLMSGASSETRAAAIAAVVETTVRRASGAPVP